MKVWRESEGAKRVTQPRYIIYMCEMVKAYVKTFKMVILYLCILL